LAGLDFHAFAHADPTPVLLVRTDGLILAANPAARRALPGVRRDGGGNLADVVSDPPKTVGRYLARCSTTRDGLLGAFTLKAPDEPLRRLRCDGAVAEPVSEGKPAIIILRCRDIQAAHEKFVTLTQKIAEQHAEIHLRATIQERLETALAEKEILLREVHHRVKNNLQVIAGLFTMAVAREPDERMRRKLVEAGNRVEAMATVQRLLYQADSVAALNAANLLAEVCESTHRSYNLANVSLLIDVPPTTISLEAATPLGLVVNELLSNAFKHAFPDGRAGTVRVSLTPSPDGRLVLLVSDDGRGMTASPRGMGLTLVEGLAMQLDGNLETGGNPGTWVRLTFKDAGRSAATKTRRSG
jgi:two-component sensor histidine kinase